ncbi:TIGR01440 family protein [Paenibacillus albicereus]|uniref:UPF0340 protein HGI30_21425 n=1 Tax=Paenibacillus albicereus TaxID=2726185 RepID=A0A6H2H2E6_9BACL|nr:TIGR01440 family protein [Paenibacillus albicereus]QJC53832.1 TIGR01440 family protein [Paenibacillus albicereus]
MDSNAASPEAIASGVETLIRELAAGGRLLPGQLLVFGVSTSEVLGRRIGTSGSAEAARAIFAGMEKARADLGFVPAFQCCEHLNRALVVERSAAEQLGLEPVNAVPVPGAGGSMAAHAYRRLADACLVESVQAQAAIDIGETLIGMHLKRVAVPVRPSVRTIGEARVTMAYARPKLIGGPRAVYELPALTGPETGSCD